MKAKVFGVSIILLLVFCSGAGASYWYFLGRFNYDVRISKAEVTDSTIPQELIHISSPTSIRDKPKHLSNKL